MVGKYVLQISVREFNDLIKSELNGELECLWKGLKNSKWYYFKISVAENNLKSHQDISKCVVVKYLYIINNYNTS